MKGFVWSRARAIARKEVDHILRDPFTVVAALGLPVLLVTFYGYAIDFDVRDIPLVVHDGDSTRASRQLAELFSSSGYFRPMAPRAGYGVLRELDSERASAVLIIRPGFGRELAAGRHADAQFILDGADNTRAGSILSYLPGLSGRASDRLAAAGGPPPWRLETRFLYNHELNSRWFIVPGLTVVVVGLVAILLTALTVAREWELGSMEMLLATPVKPLEIVAGKLAPYLGLGVAAVLLVYLVARLNFGVPFRGSHLLFAFAGLMFLVAALSQGLLISVVTRQQQLAMQLSMIMGLLPSILLSGFIFPIESMPPFFQYLTSVLPPKWFMMAARGIFLKGATAVELAKPLAALALMDLLLVTAATKRFRRDLEP